METNNTNETVGRIFLKLEERPAHARELARKTGFSHTFVNRILSNQYKKGYLTREKFGKSIVYSINQSLISAQLLSMAQKERFVRLLEKDKEFRIIMEELLENISGFLEHIDCIILFGSYVSQTYGKDSDIDLFFLASEEKDNLRKQVNQVEEVYGKEINIKVSSLESFQKGQYAPLHAEVLKGIPVYNADLFYQLKWKKDISAGSRKKEK
ncbi:MAG: nucleotidyltransferase domain-containing protein [Nanoarchaeota archaeon]